MGRSPPARVQRPGLAADGIPTRSLPACAGPTLPDQQCQTCFAISCPMWLWVKSVGGSLR